MFYYFFDYLNWRKWYYGVDNEPEKTEDLKLYKEEDIQNNENSTKVELTPANFPSLNFVNVATLETEQENSGKKKKKHR